MQELAGREVAAADSAVDSALNQVVVDSEVVAKAEAKMIPALALVSACHSKTYPDLASASASASACHSKIHLVLMSREMPQPASAAWTATAVREWVVSVAAVDVFAAAAAETPSVASAAHTSDTTVAETLGRWCRSRRHYVANDHPTGAATGIGGMGGHGGA